VNLLSPIYALLRDRGFFFTSLLTYVWDSSMQVLGHSRLSSKFQVTVPKEARKLLELDTGDMLIFITENGQLLVKRGRLQIEEWRREEP
jgi:AbrB family looped-hinge helix DNA binding protein